MQDRLAAHGIAESVSTTEFCWNYRRDESSWRAHAGRARGLLRSLGRAPESRELKPVYPRASWSAYFIWAPDGTIDDGHRFTLARLRERDAGLLVIVASKSPEHIPSEVADIADALWWKDLPGYDFSAYAIALTEIANRSPGADVFVMNDSIFGPLFPVDPLLGASPWDLTAMTASSLFENHVQSYAFHLCKFTPARLRRLRSVFFRRWSLSHFQDVVFLQETRLARVAARNMTVGAWWWAEQRDGLDVSLRLPFELIEAGMPFLKRSLFGKWRGVQPINKLRAVLHHYGHPITAGMAD